MSTATAATSAEVAEELEYCTFRVGDLLIAIDICQVEEINRQVDVTPVPLAQDYVRGVINLRGEVVTVVDLRIILGLLPLEVGKTTRTVIVRSKGEQIGLRVDRIADVVKARSDEIDPVPPNLGGVEGRFFRGVYKMETELLVVLDVDAALAWEANRATP